MDPVNLRNLDQIQEQEPVSSRRLGTLVLAGLALGIFAVVALTTRQPQAPAGDRPDPLGVLLAEVEKHEPSGVNPVDRGKITFPSVLSDNEHPTTALAAVKDAQGRLVPWQEDEVHTAEPPPAGDVLRVQPLPVGDQLNASSVTLKPKDQLTQMAVRLSEPQSTELAPLGGEGGYQIQVASFQDPNEAEKLVQQLRERGHRAYRLQTEIRGRGLWHRVRLGPFKTLGEAQTLQTAFEAKERLSTFLVDPHKLKRREDRERQQFAERAQQLEADKKP